MGACIKNIIMLSFMMLMLSPTSTASQDLMNDSNRNPRQQTEEVKLGLLTGTVLLWPMSPVERADTVSPGKAMSNVGIVIMDDSGNKKNLIYTDGQGEFSIELLPGSYTVELKEKIYMTKSLPAKIVILPSETFTLTVILDSGIR